MGATSQTPRRSRASHIDVLTTCVNTLDIEIRRAPRGLDAANLWVNSLAVPELAERVRQHRTADLESRSGKLAALFYCAQIIAAADESDPLLTPARREAAKLLRSPAL